MRLPLPKNKLVAYTIAGGLLSLVGAVILAAPNPAAQPPVPPELGPQEGPDPFAGHKWHEDDEKEDEDDDDRARPFARHLDD